MGLCLKIFQFLMLATNSILKGILREPNKILQRAAPARGLLIYDPLAHTDGHVLLWDLGSSVFTSPDLRCIFNKHNRSHFSLASKHLCEVGLRNLISQVGKLPRSKKALTGSHQGRKRQTGLDSTWQETSSWLVGLRPPQNPLQL